jgi:DNA-binding transcriptional MocR family regulator
MRRMTNSTAAPFRWTDAWAHRAGRMRPSEIREFLKLLGGPGMISFAGGIPDPELFPVEAIERSFAAIVGDPVLMAEALQYHASEGYAPLRQWIAGYMGRLGVECTSDNIVITTGSQQGIDLLARLLIDPDDTVLTLAPTYLGALQAFDIYEPRYATLDPGSEEAPRATNPAFAYAVPDFANPSGETLTSGERQRVLDQATQLDIPVIEDAAYTALRFEGEPVPSLLALDIARTGHIDRSRVVFAGTFSKTVAPGLRVGWLCGSRELIHQVVMARQAADLHSGMLDQMLVHDVVATGFDAQVARILPVYRERRDAMLAALAASMPDGTTWTSPQGGMFIWLTLPEAIDSRALLRESLETEGIIFVPGTSFHTDGGGTRQIRLNYTKPDPETIASGIAHLGGLIARSMATATAREPAMAGGARR